MPDSASEKCFLFLQGPPSGFWRRLAHALEMAGARVLKVNCCLADQMFWWKPGAVNYRGSLQEWPRWLEAYCRRNGVTDIIYYADRHPYHRVAIDVAKVAGMTGWAMEFGYLRPDWLTLVEGRLCPENLEQDDAALLQQAHDLPEPDLKQMFSHSFTQEASGEVSFHLANVLGRLLFPRYRADRFYWPPFDYLCWLPELIREPGMARKAEQVVERFRTGGEPFSLVALQLESDYQIRAASSFSHQLDMISTVFASFSACAPEEMNLIVKIHPLDNGWERWTSRLPEMATDFGLDGRVHVIKGGALERLLKATRSVVVSNSTVGLHALRAGVPTIALSEAIYNRKGLTHQGNIDQFWTSPEKADPHLSDAFIRALGTIQIKGSFYDPKGQDYAIEQALPRLLGRPDNPGNYPSKAAS